LEDISMAKRMILEWAVKIKDIRMYPGFILIRLGSSDGAAMNTIANL
jgi:hypothetical protein